MNKYIIFIIIVFIFVLTYIYMKNNNISLLVIETAIDNSIDIAIRWLIMIWNKGKYGIIAISILILYFAWQPYIVPKAITPVKDAINEGIKAKQLAIAISVGLVAGFGAPGLTVQKQILFFLILNNIGFDLGVTEFAVSTAVNFSLTIPDVFVWKSVFMHLGSLIIPAGGRYIRNFLAGFIPYIIISIPSLAILYQILFRSFNALGMNN
uniref:Uncharacterized protein n=1 Tax=viral metagenome TaxID=1070528 RepID=A0A6C0HUF6_9ZZZZ